MKDITIHVDGQPITFRWQADPGGTGGRVEAPGVGPFDAGSLDEAKDTIRSLFAAAHLHDDDPFTGAARR